MPEIVNDKTVFTLLEVTKSIQKTLADRYKSAYWVKAEMNKLNYYSHSGHCYPELVEKSNGKVIAQIKSILWRDDFLNINSNFLKVLKEPLKDGIKILFLAKITFDPGYGLSLRIIDIDPSYTLGDLETEKQETIKRLKIEGIFNKNKLLQLPMLPKRIAIISVETSKGYADFLKVLESNTWNYKFFHFLFPSLLQGDRATISIRNQLKRIKKVREHFDVVAIIRGGGGDIGLSCYNNYELAREIALFPIPVITGIGHVTNETVVEQISFSNAITPTKIAEYLLQKFHNFSVPVQRAEEKIRDKSKRLMSDEKTKFGSEIKLFRSVTENILIGNKNQIKENISTLVQQTTFRFKSEKDYLRGLRDKIKRGALIFNTSEKLKISRVIIIMRKDVISQIVQSKTALSNMEKNIENMSPESVLKRGYSITRSKGKTIKSTENLKEGDLLETIVFEGRIFSHVKSSIKTIE